MEILFTVLYAVFIGFYNIFKKLSLQKSDGLVTLVFLTSTAFACSLIWIPFGVAVPFDLLLILGLKGLLLAISWFFVLKILRTVDLTVVTATDILSVVLSFVLGIIIFGESVTWLQTIGAVVILINIAAINLCNRNGKGSANKLQILGLIFSALVTATTCVIDKFTTTYLTPYQVQFWYLFFICVFSWVFFIIHCLRKRSFLIQKKDFANFWNYLIGIFLFLGDFFLFQAYKVPGSKMILISILSKLKVIIAILGGILIFKERKVAKKIFFSLLVIAGTILISIF